ncbi:MAG: universal stress protein [Sandaracinaceae bacterium]
MPLSRSILVATDFSDAAEHGLHKARAVAADTGAKVTVCHVVDPSPLAPRGAEEDLEKSLHAALTKVIETHFSEVEETKTALIISPTPAEGICHYAEKEDTDLIVLSTHGRSGLAHLLIGSVAERVVRIAPCPVLTVRAPLN